MKTVLISPFLPGHSIGLTYLLDGEEVDYERFAWNDTKSLVNEAMKWCGFEPTSTEQYLIDRAKRQ